CLAEDDAGVLWAGTEDGGLTRYQNGRFGSHTIPGGLLNNRIEGIRAEADGQLTIATTAGMVRYANGEFVPYAPKPGDPANWFGYRDASGALWYLDDQGLHRVLGGATTSYGAPNGLSPSDIRGVNPGVYDGIYEDREHSIWIATTSKGLYLLKDGAFTFYTERNGLHGSLGPICQDKEGNLWISTAGEGLIRFKDGEGTTYAAGQGFLADNVHTIFRDGEGTLWVGTASGGLYRVTGKTIRCYTKENGLAADNVYPIFEDHAGNIWIGTWGGGLSRYAGGTFTTYSRSEGLLDNRVTALAEDGDHLWIG